MFKARRWPEADPGHAGVTAERLVPAPPPTHPPSTLLVFTCLRPCYYNKRSPQASSSICISLSKQAGLKCVLVDSRLTGEFVLKKSNDIKNTRTGLTKTPLFVYTGHLASGRDDVR